MIDEIRESLKLRSYKTLKGNLQYALAIRAVHDTLHGVPHAKLTWSYRRFQEEHTKMTQAENLDFAKRKAKQDAKYAELLKINFNDLHSWLEPVEFKTGVKAVPLVNMEEVFQEGATMHHCVGSYAESSAEGNYVVWHLTKGDVEATLGINAGYDLLTCKKYSFQQMYGKYNSIIEDKDFIEAANWIVDKMNECSKIIQLNSKEVV